MQAKQTRSDILYMTTLDTGRCSHIYIYIYICYIYICTIVIYIYTCRYIYVHFYISVLYKLCIDTLQVQDLLDVRVLASAAKSVDQH